MTDPVTDDYIAECSSPHSRLRDVVGQVRFPQRYFECFGDRLMPRPFFIPQRQIRQSAQDLGALLDILADLPRRLFDGDMGQYCNELDISKRQAALMQRIPRDRPTLFGRADLYHDGERLKLLEFNVGTQLGGIDQAQVPAALLTAEPFRAFADEHGLDYVHTGRQIAKALREAAEPVTAGAEPVVALLEADGALERLMPLMRSFIEMLRGCGLDIRLGEVSQTRYLDGKLVLDGTPIDVVLRYFSVNQICQDPKGEEAVEPIFRAHEAGGTVLLTTLDSFLYSSKGCLALLSDPYWRGAFTAAESDLVDRVLPWTRKLTADLVEQCRDRRESLLLKPANDYGGHGIVVGWTTTDADWNEALRANCERGYVVQERVVPRREPVVDPVTGRVEDWVAAWSAFLTPDGYSGSHIRALPAGEHGIIGRGANAATRVTGVFHY
ncbi:glutathionylspermidine synthase family protein [Actinocrinis puniceicyclus]|uniref:Glutathionylspermidine synthase family protein n=1 Tax=Actinocrinis puniceicyclus TaxID=977794 RepID=A0A8J7WN92_9ACTN|nr:glutathionylspermidine synthase family protein [Actinocrinis puniceicyclus]MBS2962954.1 glutathionylspermidine synthase family protein [Actinocrinis puniceicyclus]